MPSTFTSNLGITKPADGEEDGVWGDIVNENMDILDRATNGSITLSLSGTSSTLLTTPGVLTDGQYKLLILGGTPSGTHTITISPNTGQKIYFVRNTTAQSVVFTQGSGGNITIATGDSGILYTDGAGASAAVLNLTDHFSMSSVNITGGTATLTKGAFGVGAVATPSVTFSSDPNTGIWAPGADLIAVSTGGTERMRIDSTGQVAIGTAAPLAPLHVNAASGASAIRFSTADVSYAQLFASAASTNLSSITALPLIFSTNNTERMRINAGGLVGIGVTNPTILLDVQGDGLMARLRTTTTTNSYMRFDGTGTSFPYIGLLAGIGTFGNTDASPIRFNTNSAERMRILSTGEVGIGTTTPGQALDVFGTGAFSVSVATPALTNAAGTRGPNFTKGYVETVFALTGTTPALNPANGSIQTWTLTANSTPTDSVVAGESLTLMIDDGTAYTITWPSVTWKTGAGVAPTLNLTGLTAIVLWKVGSVLYGARVGDA